MTDDLVKRLETHADQVGIWPAATMRAADRIEALTAERDYTEGTNDTLIALNQSLTADNARLREALTALVDEYCDYMTINHLGDPEKQHNIKRARAALTGKEPSHE